MPTAPCGWRPRPAAMVVALPGPDTRSVTAAEITAALEADPEIGHVAMIHNETGSGIVNDPEAIGPAVRAAGRRLILDSVSAFGALPINLADHPEMRRAGLHQRQVPGRPAGHRLRGGADRQRDGGGRQCRVLGLRPVRCLRACAAGRLGQLPLHPAGAGAGGLQRGARPASSGGRPAGAAGALPGECAGDVRRGAGARPDALSRSAATRAR